MPGGGGRGEIRVARGGVGPRGRDRPRGGRRGRARREEQHREGERKKGSEYHAHSVPGGMPRPMRILRPLIVSLTVPESGRLTRAKSASSRTMLMSFSAQGMPE